MGNSGGMIVFRVLYENLKKLGCEVITISDDEIQSIPFVLSSRKVKIKMLVYRILGKKISQMLFSSLNDLEIYQKVEAAKEHNTITVYPEIYYGNPLHARNVVRWLLYYNRYPNDPYAYGKNDLFICFRQQFNDEKLNPNKYQLRMNHYDLDLYKRTNYGERHGKCYCIRKGAKRIDLPESFDGPIVDALSEEEKVKLFNQCEYFISYDTQTSYSSIAAMCGCISVVVPEPGKTREDYVTDEDNTSGIAYGFDEKEIQWAMETRDLVRKKFEDKNQKGLDETQAFVNLCKRHFGC